MKINFRKSKIVGKIADNKSEIPFLESVFEAGVDVAWLNTAHQGVEDTKMVIERIRSVAPNVGIMIDTKGPEVRTKNVEEPFEIIQTPGRPDQASHFLSRFFASS